MLNSLDFLLCLCYNDSMKDKVNQFNVIHYMNLMIDTNYTYDDICSACDAIRSKFKGLDAIQGENICGMIEQFYYLRQEVRKLDREQDEDA